MKTLSLTAALVFLSVPSFAMPSLESAGSAIAQVLQQAKKERRQLRSEAKPPEMAEARVIKASSDCREGSTSCCSGRTGICCTDCTCSHTYACVVCSPSSHYPRCADERR